MMKPDNEPGNEQIEPNVLVQSPRGCCHVSCPLWAGQNCLLLREVGEGDPRLLG